MRNTVGLFFVIGEFIVMDKSLEINLKELESIMYKEKVIVKSRLLCKMLYNVFTISTYQN